MTPTEAGALPSLGGQSGTRAVNPAAQAGVSVPVGPPSPANSGAGGPRIRARRRSGTESSFSRFLAASTTLHALLLVAGIAGGAAYQQRSGVEASGAVILVESSEARAEAPAPPAAAEERERPLERPLDSAPAEESPRLAETAPDAPLPDRPASESFAAAESPPPSAAAARSLDEVIGDPRDSWRLARQEALGLQMGLARAAHVSDCCGEPQPAPAKEAEVYVYPEVLSMARAEFPRQSQRLGEQGSVLLEMKVGVDGKVVDVRVIESSGYPRIDDCAVDAAWDWVFKPATRNGTPVEALANHRYTFRLTGAFG